MKLDSRKEHILDFIIRDYIETAQPVSSGRVAAKKVLDSSPATLRNIMLELDEDGFLYQPHTSAGRAPTERGYRYFIDNLIGDDSLPRSRALQGHAYSPAGELLCSRRRAVQGLAKPAPSANEFGLLVNEFAHDLGMFASAMIAGERNMRELAGFHDVLSEPEFLENGMLENFGRMVDEIDSVMSEYHNALIEDDDIYDIWIGRENIYPGARKGSSLVARISLPDKEELVFFAYGPTRMNYEKAIFKIKNLIEEI